MKYYYGICDKVKRDYLGHNVFILCYNTRKSKWLNDYHLPKWLDAKMSALGWDEMCEGYCSHLADGATKDALIQQLFDSIPEMAYYSGLEEPAGEAFGYDEVSV